MKDSNERCDHALHIGLSIAKVVLKVAAVAVAVCLVKEVHKVHRAIEEHK